MKTAIRPAATRASKSAFTLIELLTVIAIIGILAAIIIPTVSSVRASARQAVCASNLRQIATAVITYANDNRGILPGNLTSEGDYGTINRGIIPPGAKSDGKTIDVIVSKETDNAQLSGVLNHYLDAGKSMGIWRCLGNEAGYRASTTGVTYLCNNQVDTSPTYFFGASGKSPKRLDGGLMADATSGVTELTRIWMLCDADSINYGGYSGYPDAGASNEVLPAHKGGRNYAFFDGHVESRKLDNLPVNP
ncbi:N-terminal cleavage protein [Opitutaceae bacterium TAV5]|nr:N-terminal cleavage protein [Opitutaceae bacterium TAV5]